MADRSRPSLPEPGDPLLVVGLGLAGRAAARALLERGSTSAHGGHARPRAAGARRRRGPLAGPAERPPRRHRAGRRLARRAPDDPLLLDAAARGVPVWGEVELAWRLRGPDAAPWLALTGTNGKTTTVHMLEAILRADGAGRAPSATSASR